MHNAIFINCPFDTEYRPLLNALLFTSTYAGLIPKISETKDSGIERISVIKTLVAESHFSINDISRIQFTNNILPRFNMPFELGLDIGCKTFGNENQQAKKILILEKEQYQYQKFLSDISGNDIQAHENNEDIIIRKVRNWLVSNDFRLESTNELLEKYEEFKISFKIKTDKYSPEDIDEMPKSEFIKFFKDWCNTQKNN